MLLKEVADAHKLNWLFVRETLIALGRPADATGAVELADELVLLVTKLVLRLPFLADIQRLKLLREMCPVLLADSGPECNVPANWTLAFTDGNAVVWTGLPRMLSLETWEPAAPIPMFESLAYNVAEGWRRWLVASRTANNRTEHSL